MNARSPLAQTVVFTDVEGSTDLSAREGDVVAEQALRVHEEVVRSCLASHDGREVKALGDGFLLSFRSARDAVTCALSIQDELRKRGDDVRVRIGANTGAVVERDGDLFGATVNAAARIAAHARGGQVLVSPSVLEEAGRFDDAAVLDRGLFWIKGFPERWRLFEVRHARAAIDPDATTARSQLIGREEERADLRRRLDEAAAGRGSFVLIGGEPGVGKTRLAAEVTAEATTRGMLAFTGHCSDAEGAPPYLPVVEIVEAALRLVPTDVFRETIGESAGEMARLVPEIRRRFPDIPPPLELPPEQSRRYLWTSVREFVDRTGRRRPLLLVLDDLHWADESTLLLLEYLAPELSGMPVLVLGTYRDVELDVARPLARTLDELVRRRQVHRISLSRLGRDEVRSMLHVLSGQHPPERLADTIYAETEGNPFFVEEVFQHLAEEGRIFDDAGRWLHEVEIGEVDVPESVRLVLGRRLERLSEDARAVLTAGAVLGRSFGLEVVEGVARTDEDAVLDGLDEAERAKLITSSSLPGTATFAFAHELIRQTLLAQLSLIRRQRLHLRAADVLERLHADNNLDEHAPEIANHLMESGPGADPDRMRRFCRLAGERALEAAAFGEAVRHLENALSMEPEDERERADLLANLGLALRSVGRWEEAVEIWGQALAAYEALGDAEHVGALAADVALNTAWAARWEESFAITARGLSALAGRDTVDRIRLLGLGAVMVSSAGNHDGAHQMLVDGHRVARELDIEPSETYLSAAEVIHHYSFMRMRDVIAAGEVAMATLRASGAAWELVSVQHWVAFALAFTNRWDDARSLLDEMDPVADRLGHLGAQLFSHRIRGLMALLESGDMTILERTSERDIELCRKAGFPWDSHSYVWLGLVEGGRGNAERSNELFEEALKREPAGAYAGVAEGFDMLMRAYLGDSEGSLARWRSRRDEYLTPNVKTFGGWMFVLCGIEAHIVLGHAEEAAELHPLVLEAIATGTELRGWDGASLERLAGMTAAAAESWDEAESHFARAMEFARRYPNVAEAALIKLWYGRSLLDRGRSDDRERARTMLSEAHERFAALRMGPHEERARALLERVDSAALSSGGSSSA